MKITASLMRRIRKGVKTNTHNDKKVTDFSLATFRFALVNLRFTVDFFNFAFTKSN